jgi:hypothetical protein
MTINESYLADFSLEETALMSANAFCSSPAQVIPVALIHGDFLRHSHK